ncbi:MAG: response regulator [Firmicutes bacterium]|nr:response regulator [Bacillota bacterium]MCL5039573.1 response regulator [Bacillota bacterium]
MIGLEQLPKLLVVDDQAPIRRLLEEIFRRDRLTVVSVSNGVEAIEVAQREKPVAALIDLRMPGQGGLETLRQLKDIDPDLPVVMMTALGDEVEVKEAQRLGCSCFLAKPFDINEVRVLIFSLLRQRSF